MFEESIRYPFNRDDSLTQILIGGLIYLLGSVLVLPIPVIYGYALDVMESVVAGKETTPDFDGFLDLFIEGLKAIFIGIAYSVPVFLAASAIIAIVGTGGSAFASGLSFAILVAVSFLAPAGIVNYAVERNLKSAFHVERISVVVSSRRYWHAILLTLVTSVLYFIAIAVLSFTLIGMIFTPFVMFALLVTNSYILAKGYTGAHA